jgi:hypothetical protein
MIRLPLAILALTLSGSLILFAFLPYAVRPRFLLFGVPLYLLAIAVVFTSTRFWLATVGLAIWLGISGVSLVQMYNIEPQVVEPDAITIKERLEAAARSGDAVIFHAYWQVGYLAAHYRGPSVSFYNLRELQPADYATRFAGHQRLWLAMFRTEERNPEYPIEEWLDQQWTLVDKSNIGETRLKLYARLPEVRQWNPVRTKFENEAGMPQIELIDGGVAEKIRGPGDAVSIYLRWRALSPITDRYAVFAKIIDGRGHSWASADREPNGGTAPTITWPAGQVVEDHIGLLVPEEMPPGFYKIQVGLHPTDNAHPLTGRTHEGVLVRQGVTIEDINVTSLTEAPATVMVRNNVRLGDSLQLVGSRLDINAYRVEAVQSVTASTDLPIKLFFPKKSYQSGEDVNLVLYWRPIGVVHGDYTAFVHLLDSTGNLVAQSDGPPTRGVFPTSRWRSSMVIADQRSIQLPLGLAPGRYQLIGGMYLPDTLERLPVPNNSLEGNTIDIGWILVDKCD